MAKPSVKQHLAAIRQLFDYLVTGGIPAVKPGRRGARTQVRGEARQNAGAVGGPGATAIGFNRCDRAQRTSRPGPDRRHGLQLRPRQCRRGAAQSRIISRPASDAWLRLHEKGGKRHEVPCHHNLAAYLDAWIDAAGIAGDKKGPLFRAIRKGNKLTENPMARSDVLVMIKRRAAVAALPYSTCCHTFRATGITTYMQNGGTLEHAQQIAAHESPRTTKLYDRTREELTAEEIERIRI